MRQSWRDELPASQDIFRLEQRMRVVFSSISKHTDGQWPVGISKGVRVAMCLVLLQNGSL